MKKGFIIAAVVLVAVGLAVFAGAFVASGFDFSKIGSDSYVTNTYTVDKEFDRIDIDTNVTDIVFKPSEDGKFSAVCSEERDKVHHKVTVEDGTLKITINDDREWFEYISFLSKSMTMTLYLPGERYESLKIDASTGDVSIPSSFSFGSIDIKMSTGDVLCSASSEGPLKIKASTGDITLNGAGAGDAELSVSTGKILVESFECGGNMSVKVSTGKATLSDVTCREFISEGSTGSLTLKNVVASGKINVKRSTGDVKFDSSDAAEIAVKTSTGDVTGTLKSEMIFFADTRTGDVDVPRTTTGGKCEISTTTGDIEIKIVK
ncbi:MAG: DUF4097 family beta strand repeat protein [Clostridia bacterium]|nr:DUF4097 family beta strand repeat protein [Clostridia bacterium]